MEVQVSPCSGTGALHWGNWDGREKSTEHEEGFQQRYTAKQQAVFGLGWDSAGLQGESCNMEWLRPTLGGTGGEGMGAPTPHRLTKFNFLPTSAQPRCANL
jgi:hypothetical protein